MIKIAIVEDEQKNIESLLSFFETYQKAVNKAYLIQTFSDGSEFIAQVEQKWNLILLDIEMPNLNGIETAKRIREVNQDAKIVFVTQMEKYAVEGYLYQASDYILKPLNYNEFFLKIGRLLERMEKIDSDSLLISNRSQMLKLSLSEISYIESQGHTIIIHMSDKTDYESTASGTLNELEERLSKKGFYRCYKCYLVNLGYVYDIKDTCVMQDGTQLTIGRGKKKEFRRILMDYVVGV